MCNKKTLLIVKDPASARKNYLIDEIAIRWNNPDYRVVQHAGFRDIPDADIAVLHVDQTRVEPVYINALSNHRAVLNRVAMDVSKRRFSQIQVEREDEYWGPVILKTNLNFGGIPESGKVGFALARLASMWNIGSSTVLNPYKYPIFQSKLEVPDRAWTNENLIVEKFLPEQEDELFFIRYWVFLGDIGWAGRLGAKHPIVKWSRMVTEDERVPVPDQLVRLRKDMGLDYGRFDFVVHGNEPYVFDVNKTIGCAMDPSPFHKPLQELAEGFNSFIN